MIFQTLKTSTQDIMEHFQLVGVPFGHGLNTTDEEVVWWPDSRGMYLTFVARESNVTFQFSGSSASNTLQYKKNGDQEWTTLAAGASTPAIQSGDTIMFKASGLTINSTSGIGQFISTGQFEAQGNAMSLVFGDDFYGQTSLSGKNYVFRYLFSGCTGITYAENLSLPATTLAESCYRAMFSGCTSLTTAPELPATTLASNCYWNMFLGCTSLTTAPELPATTLAERCYYYMFYHCTSLTTAPELPATTLANNCYYSMFNGCTGLTTAPELPATALTNYCYRGMFQGCTNLNYVKCLAETGMTSNSCLLSWLSGVASTGTFVKSTNATTGSTAEASQWQINSENGIPSGWTIINDGFDPSQMYLTIKAGSNGYTLKYSRLGNSYSLDTSIDSGNTWVTIATSDTVTVNAGQSLMVRGTNLSSDPDTYSLNFKITGTCSLEGNVLSLEYGDNFINQTALPNKDSLFRGLFANNTGITSAENLALVATSLTSSWGAYEEMFAGCTSLTTAPELPATTLNERCYAVMFAGCTSLTTAPELPATTLAYDCYHSMFSGCTSLTTAPELPATTLAEWCYGSMFRGCTSLTTAPELPATTLTNSCYSHMFRGCTSLTTAPELPATTLADYCYQYMFQGCTKLNYVKCMASYGMSGSTLAYWLSGVASKGRFVMSEDATTGTTTGNTQWKIDSGDGIPSGWTFTYDTTYLTFISAENGNMFKFSGTSASNILQYSLDNGNTWTSLGHDTNSPAVDSGKSITFKGSNMSTNSSNGIGHFISTGQFKAEGNVMSIISGDSFSAQTSLTGKTSAFTALFMDCTGLTTAEKLILPATTLGNKCYASMFSGCTNLTTAPELPATTLVNSCYYGMFSGCTSLNYIKCLACSGMSATNCLTNWVSGVASSGTFVRSVLSTIGATSGDTRWASNSVNGIPVNWIRETNSKESPLVFISHASNNTIKFMRSGGTGTSLKTIEVSTDLGKTWTSKASASSGATLATLQSGGTLLIRGNNPQYSSGTASGNVFTSTAEFEAAGNIMSLVGSTNFTKNTELLSAWTFANLFSGCTALTSVDNLVLPAVDLMEGCYYQMFIGCSFTKAPELPATTLAASCYRGMFNRCFNLTLPPELPATTLTDQCYRYMFNSCTTLTIAPELPAETLVSYCYFYMFAGCSNLNYIKCLASSGMTSSSCLSSWVSGVSSSGTFVKSPNAATGSTAGASQWCINNINGIPSGWTVQSA